ncbi:hypothetical protein ACIRPK_17015 [Kitasatospora sp. NPDC101801]|uniref:hypothetical protein n=1 Tax=Kitasatospora sp. NPDC101801 TaxID=3364103 RepID=UPI00381A3A26
MSHEDDLAKALRGAAALAPQPSPPAFAAGAAARGRAIRRRRRAAALAGAAALALCTVTAVAVLPGAGGGTTVASEDPSISAAFMEQTVRALLPPGQVAEVRASGVTKAKPFGEIAQIALTLDDGKGPTQLGLTTERVALPVDADTPGTECMAGIQHGTCERTVRPDGTILVVEQDSWVQAPVRRQWVVTATTTDGRRIRLEASLAAGERTDSAVGVPQMIGIVTSSTWDPVFGAVTTPRYPKEAFSGLPAARIAATATALLPPGVTAKAPDGRFANGQTVLTLTGQDRQVVLNLGAQPKAMITREAFEAGADPSTLIRTADGTSVVRRESRADSDESGPVLSWSAEALHPDGTRVSVGQTAPGVWPDVPPLSGREVLTMDQLVAIAASPTWRG